MNRGTVTYEDLGSAAEWLRCYEAGTDPEDQEVAARMRRVADFLEREMQRRAIRSGRDKAIRQFAKEKGVSPSAVRAALRDKRTRP